MKIQFNQNFNTLKPLSKPQTEPLRDFGATNKISYNKISSEQYRANFLPLSFTGNAPKIKRAYIISSKEDNIPLMPTKERNSYIVEFDSQTELLYGEDAIKFLNSTDSFEYDTQVLLPKKAEGVLQTEGKTVKLAENSAVLIGAGTKAKITDIKGYPTVVLTKQDHSWYERYSKTAKDSNIRDKFLELMYYNSHLYNGDFSPNALLPDRIRDEGYLKALGIDKWGSKNNILCLLYDSRDKLPEGDRYIVETAKSAMDKLYANNCIQQAEDGFVRLTPYYNSEYFENYLSEKGLTNEEIKILSPVTKRARRVRLDSKIACMNWAKDYREDLIPRLKEAKIFHNNKTHLDKVYWQELFPNEALLRARLQKSGFNKEDEDSVVESWHKTNMTGFDISGLKFINNDIAVYNLDDKINNWTQEATNWLSNSTELASTKGDAPFLGVSFVQCDEGLHSIHEIRQGESLHSHPALEMKKQSEIYMITSGAAALTVVKNDKPQICILKEGDLAIIGPGVKHCINSVMGEYEQVVTQVPSSFQYGFGFKQQEKYPAGFDESTLDMEAAQKLNDYLKENPSSNNSK
ncbi:hypothetical protein IKQ26_01915 [bacterium]|nr:hypothetical protein [bacterium]